MDNQAIRTDAELLQLSVAGDESAFVLLYERLKVGIFRYAFYMTNSPATAEEVTQEVFISLLEDGANYRPHRGDVAAFVFGIARNFVRRAKRREYRLQPLPGDDALQNLSATLTSEPESLSGRLIQSERAERVQNAIASLPDHYRQVVVLCDLCELPYAEAATRLRCAVGTVRSRLNRAHALLIKKLKSLKDDQPDVGTAGTEECLT